MAACRCFRSRRDSCRAAAQLGTMEPRALMMTQEAGGGEETGEASDEGEEGEAEADGEGDENNDSDGDGFAEAASVSAA